MNPKIIKVALFVWILGLCLVNSRMVRAQVAGGTLSGSITDPSGAVVANAQVVINRLIYLSEINNVIYVLHCFEKQGSRTPRKDLKTAKKRLSDVHARLRRGEE